ncbi:MAG: beta strand repeat-containing protein [Phycisphaerales bacterium JB065]
MNRACVIALASGLAVSVAVGAGEINWASPVDGMWNSAPNWSPAMVPSAPGDVAVLGFSDPYTVQMNASPTISGIVISNPNAALTIDPGRTISLGFGGLFNDGWLIVNPNNVGATTTLQFNNSVEIEGSGLLTLGGSASRARINSISDALLTNGMNHTISGFGQITIRFDNQGWIVADSTGNELSMSGGEKTNSGVISAIGGGSLLLSSTVVTQDGGVIEADGGTVTLSNSTVSGGTLLNPGWPGSLLAFNTSTLDSVTISGDSQLNAGHTLTVAGGSLTNDGVLYINPNNVAATTTMNFPDSVLISGTGTIRLDGNDSRARILGADGATVENSSSHSIRGFGQILSDFTNSGLVVADVEGRDLELRSGNKLNLNVIRAESGGRLQFVLTTVDQTDAAEILADGGMVDLNNSTINHGRLINSESAGSAAIINGSVTLNDMFIQGQWDLNPGQFLTLRGVTDGPGTILVNPTDTAATTSIELNEDATLEGSGTIRLNGALTRARIISDAGVTLTQGADRAIFGYGSITAGFVNNGLVEADVDGVAIRFNGQDKVNNALFQATGGGELEFQGTMVDQTGGGVIAANGGQVLISGTTVLGGTISNTNEPGSEVIFFSTTVDSITLEGDTTLSEGNTLTVAGGTLTNNGTLTINPSNVAALTSLNTPGNTVVNGTGEIVLAASTVRARLSNSSDELLTLGSGQTLSGIGQIAAVIQIEGTFAPGMSVGTMTGTRPVSFGPTATYACEFNDVGGADRYQTSSTVALGGTLDIAFIDGFTASSPEAFEIIATGINGVIGRFDQVTGDGPDLPLITRVVYEPTRVRVGFVCPSDANLDGATDLGDLNAVLANFGTNASLGDVTGDGAVDLADLNMVLANFGTDCTD